jgi:hypothetical protein
MSSRRIGSCLAAITFGAAAVTAVAAGCSSTPASSLCASGSVVACTCGDGRQGTQSCGLPGCACGEDAGEVDASSSSDDGGDVPGDATHKDEQPPPSVTYGVCALQGGFGWPCTAEASGPDPSECTDPRFSVCFVGAQSARCTADCADGSFTACPQLDADTPEVGCVPTDCNARGFCK